MSKMAELKSTYNIIQIYSYVGKSLCSSGGESSEGRRIELRRLLLLARCYCHWSADENTVWLTDRADSILQERKNERYGIVGRGGLGAKKLNC